MGLFNFFKKKEEGVVKPMKAIGNPQKVIFVEKAIRGNKTYFCYDAPSKADALAFLDTQIVTQPLHYVAVYTPEGKFGKDKDGGYEF